MKEKKKVASEPKEEVKRNNKTISGYNIAKEKDGWRVVEIIAQTNGRCSFNYLSLPDLRVFAIEKLRKLLESQLWRDE